VARTTGSWSSGSGGSTGSLGTPGIGSPGSGAVTAVESVRVVRRTRSLVLVAASRVDCTTPAIEAPVTSRTPASSRKTKRMCDPASENSLDELQNRLSPTSPPWRWR
jgi:hypothetical protein